MPNRYSPRDADPVNRAVYGWDDGVEYISPESLDSSPATSSRRSRRDRSPPPPYSSGATRHKTARYIPQTPPEDAEPSSRRSRRRQLSPSPPPTPPRRHRTHRSPSPRRHDRRPPLTSSKTTPNFSYSSDRPSDRPSRHRSHRHRPSPSPSPPPKPSRRRTEPPTRSNTTKAKSSSPATKRPSAARSKTAKDFAGLVASPRIQQAAAAALQAGGATAFKLRKQPGNWAGGKGAKVATAAIGAAAMSGFSSKDGGKEKGGDGGGKMPGGVGAVGGLLAGALADAVSKKGKK